MSGDKHGKGDGDRLLYCSFCGKSQHEVRKLIAGPSVFICDECVDLCNAIISEEIQEKSAAGAGTALALTATSACTTRPTFCRPSSGRKRPPVGTTA